MGLLGLVSERKNQLVAAEAVALTAARGADVRLLLAGDSFKDSTDYGERLRERLAADDLRDRAVWLPFQKDAAALYRSMDINLLISGEEGFGRTIIEAGAAGRPSIGARIGGIPEIIEEGRTAGSSTRATPARSPTCSYLRWPGGARSSPPRARPPAVASTPTHDPGARCRDDRGLAECIDAHR